MSFSVCVCGGVRVGMTSANICFKGWIPKDFTRDDWLMPTLHSVLHLSPWDSNIILVNKHLPH